MRLFKGFVAAVLLAICIACGNQEATNNNASPQAVSGSAVEPDPYEESYRKEGRALAQRIQTLDEAVRESGSSIQAMPVIGGGAYVVTKYGTWFLKGSSAYRVTDGPASSLKSSGPAVEPKANDLWALWQTERANLARVKRIARSDKEAHESYVEELNRELEEAKRRAEN